MKQKDVALILVIAIISGTLSFVVSSKFVKTPHNSQQKVEKVDAITTDFSGFNDKYFNQNSIDPAQFVQIGNNHNLNPFSGTNN